MLPETVATALIARFNFAYFRPCESTAFTTLFMGAFTEAQAIVRMGTSGGTAPGDGCDETRAGRELRVPYTAIYVFLK